MPLVRSIAFSCRRCYVFLFFFVLSLRPLFYLFVSNAVFAGYRFCTRGDYGDAAAAATADANAAAAADGDASADDEDDNEGDSGGGVGSSIDH